MPDISKLAVILTANAGGFSTNLNKAGVDLDAFAGRVQGVGSRVAGAFVAMAVAGAAALGGLSIGKGLNLAAEAEDTQMQMTVLLKSAEKAKAVLATLDDYATKTSFGMADLAPAATSLIATGSAANMVGAEVRMLGDIAMGAKIPLGELAAMYGKMRSGKFIQAEELNQLVGRGIPVFKEFARILGVSETQVKKLASENKITFDVLQKAFADLTAKGGDYADMAVKMGEGTKGTFAQMQDAVDKSLKRIGAALIDELNVKGGMKELTGWIESFGAKAQGVLVDTLRWVREHADGLMMIGKVAAAAAGGVALYRTALFAVTAAQKVYALGQAAILALSGPKGWAILAGAAVATGVAYVGINAAFNGIERSAAAAAVSNDKLAESTTAAERAALDAKAAEDLRKGKADALAAGVDNLTKKLQEQVATFGMSTGQVEAYKLAQQGATAADLARVGALATQLEQMEANKKAMDEMTRAAEKYAEDIRSPWAKLYDTLAEINKLEKSGLLTADQAARASRKARAEAEKDKARDAAKPGAPEIARANLDVIEKRFTAGFTAANTPAEEQARKLAERTAKAAEKTARNTDTLAAKASAPAGGTDI